MADTKVIVIILPISYGNKILKSHCNYDSM